METNAQGSAAHPPGRAKGALTRVVGSLRRRFVVLLVLLAVSSLMPWRLAVGLHEHLQGFGKRLELASSLRDETADLMQLLQRDGGTAMGREAVRRILDDQRRTLTMLVDGDEAAGLPPCPTKAICSRLEEHRARWYREIAPAAWELADSGHTADADALMRDLLREVAQLDGTLHLMAASAETRVDEVMASGLFAVIASLVLLALVGFGVGEVFARIRRVREAASDPPSEGVLERQAQAADEVGSLAGSLLASVRSLKAQGEAERRRALQLDARQRALRSLAAGLNDWIGGDGALDDVITRAARVAGFEHGQVTAAEASPDPLGLPAPTAHRERLRVPLTWGDHALGTLALLRREAGPLEGEEEALADAFGRTVSIALVARDLLSEREARTELAAWLSTQRDMGEGARALFDHLRPLIGHDTGILSIVDDTGSVEQCFRVTAAGLDRLEAACPMDVPRAVTLLSAGALPGLDLGADPDASALSVPLLVEHRAVGLLLLVRSAPFSGREVEIAQTLAPVVASTLERMRLTERLHLSEHLATVGGLSRMVAHEVRNPLNSLGLHLRLLEKTLGRVEIDDRERARLAEHLGVLRGEVDRLDGVVESYVALATGRRSARFEPTDVRELVEEVVTVHRARMAARGVECHLELGDVPADAMVDRLRFQQAVHNILCNAIEAVEERPGGRVAVVLEDRGDAWALRVRDNGPGLADPRRIFSPGYTTKSAGSGMGLPISLQIARLHGGGLVARRLDEGGAELVLTVARAGASSAALASR